MYSHRLNTPPPTSQFRRPWSPEPFDYNPRDRFTQQYPQTPHNATPYPQDDWYQRGRRLEPSDVSVEALDLADYAMTLRRPIDTRSNLATPYPPFHAVDQYLQSPPPIRTLEGRDSLSPPSLTSAGASSQDHSQSSLPHTPIRRPFSLPAVHHHSPSPLPSYAHRDIADTPYSQRDYADDMPQWPGNLHDIEGQKSHLPNVFDPAANHSLHANYSPKVYPHSDSSHRDMLPWSGLETESGLGTTAQMKEERLRMLEHEFGPQSQDVQVQVVNKSVGGVDHKGNIITDGPKKRRIVRCTQGFLAVGTVIASLYSALLLKPIGTPPPRGKLPAYVLYIASVITVLLMLYLFVFRPCCCGGRQKKPLPHEGPAGMMVLPVQSLPGGRNEKKKGKKGKKGQSNDGSVQVNLIVDPTLFGNHGRDQDDNTTDIGDLASHSSNSRVPKRRSVWEGLAMEEQWKTARSFLKWITFYDVTSMILWGFVFVLVLLGSRCPSGKFEGWCDGYNVATALACFLCVTFGVSLYFDIKDLHFSRVSPRTRT
ncbi:hypothetical protein BD410DRAFT_740418 [Rickenella mellea]|uniref:Uncharacterized protein n=1 Tax=Rickenella mellea TaxID=50990 RepID=A0A4Y7QJK3_9AGAM|nr:hypothetical protein BD410DRAFT_740418 [Rickenella mellea]